MVNIAYKIEKEINCHLGFRGEIYLGHDINLLLVDKDFGNASLSRVVQNLGGEIVAIGIWSSQVRMTNAWYSTSEL